MKCISVDFKCFTHLSEMNELNHIQTCFFIYFSMDFDEIFTGGLECPNATLKSFQLFTLHRFSGTVNWSQLTHFSTDFGEILRDALECPNATFD